MGIGIRIERKGNGLTVRNCGLGMRGWARGTSALDRKQF